MENIVKSKTKILNYINVFRGLAILLIIMGHTMQFAPQNSLIHIADCEVICGGTALFIFISGFLFQHLSYKFEYKNYLSKKWTNVVMPYLITSIPGIFFCFYCPVAYKNSFMGLNPFIQTFVHLSIGRVHNVPSWFIPMIVMFFICSSLLLKLEKKNILYKLLPLFFLLTIFLPRGVAEYENTIGLSYIDKYLVYVKYIFSNFIHFLSLYVFGMYCSKYKDIIDKFYSKRIVIFLFMIVSALVDIFLQYKYGFSNNTISKIFLTMLTLAYLKHYDEWLISHKTLNKALDIFAKYSFGLFFVHWYWFFIVRQFLPNITDMPQTITQLSGMILNVGFRFLTVTFLSFLSLYIAKSAFQRFDKNINTRKFIGI